MKRPNFSWKYALILTGIAVLAYLVMDFNSRMAELRQLSIQRESVAAEVTSLEATKIKLETQIAYATTDPAVVQWAYEEGHLVRPGDNPVIPLPAAQATPAPTPAPRVVRQNIANWQIWLWLFMDTGAPQGNRSP